MRVQTVQQISLFNNCSIHKSTFYHTYFEESSALVQIWIKLSTILEYNFTLKSMGETIKFLEFLIDLGEGIVQTERAFL